MGMTIGTFRGSGTGSSCFLQSNLQEDKDKVFHESGPILYEGGPTQRMVLKQLVKLVLAAAQLLESEV